MPLRVNIGDRWAIIGATGSGKTVLSREILKFYANATKGLVPIYILDTKVQGDFKQFEHPSLGRVVRGNKIPDPVTNTKGKPFTIWQPESDDEEMYDKFFEQIYLKGRNMKSGNPGIIYIDEISSVSSPSGRSFPRYWDILLKQGRGMDIGLINVTQSPSYIPPNLLRQATHVVRMHLNGEYDPKKMSSAMGKAANEEPVDDYGFYYRNQSKPIRKSPVMYYSGFQEFFGLE